MSDKHLNLFYTYNRDTALIENNLTRALIVFLSVLSDETRHSILSMLLETSRKPIDDPAGRVDIEGLDFSSARFALQSNLDRYIPRNSDTRLLLTISTEPLAITSDVASNVTVTSVEFADEGVSDTRFSARPDAWIYDEAQRYCILIEVKVGSNPLNIDQLEAHARDWYETSLQSLNARNSLCSITWIDVLETLDEALNGGFYASSSEEALLLHMMEFIGFCGYQLFEGFDFGNLHTPPVLAIGNASLPAISLDFHHLTSPPDVVLTYRSRVPRQGGAG